MLTKDFYRGPGGLSDVMQPESPEFQAGFGVIEPLVQPVFAALSPAEQTRLSQVVGGGLDPASVQAMARGTLARLGQVDFPPSEFITSWLDPASVRAVTKVSPTGIGPWFERWDPSTGQIQDPQPGEGQSD